MDKIPRDKFRDGICRKEAVLAKEGNAKDYLSWTPKSPHLPFNQTHGQSSLTNQL